MNKVITEQESWQGLELTYSYELIEDCVAEVTVSGEKHFEGGGLSISRRYWRDMTFAPTQSEQMLTAEENEHIAERVADIWESYPDIHLDEPLNAE